MKNLRMYALLLFSAVCCVSCEDKSLSTPTPLEAKGTSNSTSQSPDDAQLIAQAQQWFQRQIDDATVLDVVVAYTKPLRWDYAIVSGTQKIVFVPEDDNYTRATYAADMSPTGFRDVLIEYDAGTAGLRANLMEVRPSAAYIAGKIAANPGIAPTNLRALIAMGDFSGYLLFYEGRHGSLVYAQKFDNGVHVSNLQIPGYGVIRDPMLDQ